MSEALLRGEAAFELNRVIGNTLQGRVYLGRDKNDNSKVAVKEAFKVLVARGQSRDGHRVAEDFLLERNIHMTVSQQHDAPPGLLRLKDSWELDHSYFVALEWCDGGEMFDYVREQMERSRNTTQAIAQLPQEPAVTLNGWTTAVQDIFKQHIETVAYLHSNGVVHRDLSLENTLMVSVESTLIKIIDFGVAKKFEDGDFTCSAGRVGKLGYMAPEVYAKQPYDGRAADIWSLGVMLFMLLVGCPPYDIPTRKSAAFQFIMRGDLRTVLAHWKRLPMVPADALDLLERIFRAEPDRITMEEIWCHPFVNFDGLPPRGFWIPPDWQSEVARNLSRSIDDGMNNIQLQRTLKDVTQALERLNSNDERRSESSEESPPREPDPNMLVDSPPITRLISDAPEDDVKAPESEPCAKHVVIEELTWLKRSILKMLTKFQRGKNPTKISDTTERENTSHQPQSG